MKMNFWTWLRYVFMGRVLAFFNLTGIKVCVSDNYGRKKKVDIMRLAPGMSVTNYEGTVLLVTGYTYDDGIDYVVPCSDGVAYSPLYLK